MEWLILGPGLEMQCELEIFCHISSKKGLKYLKGDQAKEIQEPT